MSEIKKYHYGLGRFLHYGANYAGGISTKVPALLKEDEQSISVETGLSRISEKLDTLFGNVAWLAKYGGGGSGSGGGGIGGGITEATATILVNGVPSGEQVVMSTDGLEIRLDGLTAVLTKSWNITITVGATQIAASTLSFVNNVMYVSASRISQALTNHQGRLQVVASYADDANGIYGNALWSGTVIESTISISVNNDSSSLEELLAKEFVIGYSVGYLGDSSRENYRLTVNVFQGTRLIKEYTENLRITQTSQQSKSLPVFGNLIESDDAQAIGVYRFEVSLTNIENPVLSGTVSANFVLASQNILISSSTMSEDEENPGSVPISGSLTISFTAYVQALVSYTYDVFVGETQIISNASGRFGTEQVVTLSVSGKEWAVEGSSAAVRIVVKSGDKTGQATYYIKFVDSGDSFLSSRETIKTHMLTSLRALDYNSGQRDFQYSNPEYVRGGSTYNLVSTMKSLNPNNLSVIRNKADGMPYLRLSNGAMLKVENWKLQSSAQNYDYTFKDFFPNNVSAVNEFTISLCFKADYHADDYRTILFCGVLDSTTEEISTGISIDVHNIYINGDSVYELSDNTVNMVDIVCIRNETHRQNSEGVVVPVLTYIIKVYVDGVVTATQEITNGFLTLGEHIYLGGRHYKNGTEDVYTYKCDCEIYDFKIYDTALTDFDIMVNRANSLALTSYNENQPNYKLITAELRKNFCSRKADGSIESLLYDPETGVYTVDFLMDMREGLSVLNEQNLKDYASALGIPIMFIDVSTDSNWKFTEFSNQQTAGAVSMPKTEGRRIQYWDPNGDNTSVVTLNNMTIDLQGTSTLADFVKNLNITTPDDTVFIPKAHWLFEQTYTLKADVVDSSHSCNASFGRFINEKFGYNESNQSSYLPLPAEAISNVYDTPFHRNQQPTGTIKHTVEGFPILLIMKFYTDESSSVSITPLGIYSFNLGRNAYHNLGFKRINSITVNGETPQIGVFPYVAEHADINESDGNANWIEIKYTTSVADLVNVKNRLPEDFDSSMGDFWQNDTNIMNERYEVRYPSGRSVSEYPKFREFLTNIMRLPLEGCYTTNSLGAVTKPTISGAFDQYTCDTDGTNYRKTGQRFSMSVDSNDFTDNLGFNLDSFLRYFVIGSLGGAIDNFGKNMTFRSWAGGDYYAGFYDLDCLFGGGNQGLLDIEYDAWVKYLTNNRDGEEDYGYIGETFNGTEALSQTVFSANHNKLWLSLDTEISRNVFRRTGVNSLYTQTWYNLRQMLDSYASAAGYKTFWDYYTEEYFVKQTGECGPLLFNYDYKLKYFLQFTSDDYNDTKALTKLHGRKVAYTRTWLKRRITFLDSLFYWRDNSQTMGFKNDVNSRGANSVYTTPKAFPIKTNTSLVMYHSVGDNTKTYYFMPKNTAVLVNAGNSSSDSILNWNFSNSPNVIELGNGAIKLADMNVANLSYQQNLSNIDYVGYPSITDLDFSQNKKFNGFNLSAFKPSAGIGEIYDRLPISELRTMDFSNTAGASFNLDLTYIAGGVEDTWFQKLQRIDISGSTCISNLSIPDIPLTELVVRGSYITNFNLKNQAYLPEVDLTGCSRLQTISIDGCAGYRNFVISNLNNLTSCNIVDCENLETITITSCNVLNKLNIENCPNLKSIVVTGCPALTGTGQNVVIQDCTNLTDISFQGCSNLETIRMSNVNKENIKTLNLKSTKVFFITGDSVDESLLDLSEFVSLTSFDISSNASVEEIQFMNDDTKPAIPLINNFQGCAKLKRIYGKVSIGVTGIFNACKNFSVHGTENPMYFGQAAFVNNVAKLPSSINSSSYFQSGKRVTNMEIGVTSLSSSFKQTSCTAFDIYYILERAENVTTLSSAFYNLTKPAFGWTSSYDNSPNRNMFAKATKLANLSEAFRQDSSNQVIRLFSPSLTLAEDGSIQSGTDNGLLSPLVDSVTNINTMFYGYTTVTDRKFFRHKSKDYKITSANYFWPSKIVDDVNSINYTRYSNSLTYLRNGDTSYGNVTKMFDQLQNLASSYYLLNGVEYLDFDTLSRVPGKNNEYSFNATYGKGTISSVARLFSNPESVTIIQNCFRVSSRLAVNGENQTVKLNISNDLLAGMTNLTKLGYHDEESSTPLSTPMSCSFSGYGYEKNIQGSEFPYRILDSCKKIEMFAGLFEECYWANMSSVPALPGNMFENTPNIKNVSALFYNLNFNYTLSGRGFAKCPNLKRAAYLFGADATNGNERKNFGIGSIPFEMFYHGEKTESKTYEGTVGEIITETMPDGHTRYTIHRETGQTYYCDIIGGVAQWTSEDNSTSVSKSDVLDSLTVSYRKVNNNIVDLSHCFRRANFSPYEGVSSDNANKVERNSDYQTFNWLFVNNTFQQVVQDNDYYTEQWSYDGSSEHVGMHDDKPVKNLDDANNGITPTIYDVSSSSEKGGTLNYCCAPDLLRYCSTTEAINITNMFRDGGHDVASSAWGQDFSRNGYGITGRIPSVLLLPFKNNTRAISLDYMFTNCKMLSSYTNDGRSYMIPKSFFENCPRISSMVYTFSGMTFNHDINLAVFSSIVSSGLTDINHIFYMCYYVTTNTNRANLAGVFSTLKNLSSAAWAFAATYNGSNAGIKQTNPYLTLSDIFPIGTYTKSAYADNQNFAYVFAYFDNTVIHEETKTLIDNTSTNNYIRYGNA